MSMAFRAIPSLAKMLKAVSMVDSKLNGEYMKVPIDSIILHAFSVGYHVNVQPANGQYLPVKGCQPKLNRTVKFWSLP
jgi:hypothetical protein